MKIGYSYNKRTVLKDLSGNTVQTFYARQISAYSVTGSIQWLGRADNDAILVIATQDPIGASIDDMPSFYKINFDGSEFIISDVRKQAITAVRSKIKPKYEWVITLK